MKENISFGPVRVQSQTATQEPVYEEADILQQPVNVHTGGNVAYGHIKPYSERIGTPWSRNFLLIYSKFCTFSKCDAVVALSLIACSSWQSQCSNNLHFDCMPCFACIFTFPSIDWCRSYVHCTKVTFMENKCTNAHTHTLS